MKRRCKKISMLLLVLGVIVTGLRIYFDKQGEMLGPITLEDGSVLYFRGVTVGTNHLYPSPLVKIVRFLPDNLRTNLAAKFPEHFQPLTFTTPRHSLVVWLDGAGFTNYSEGVYETYITSVEQPVSGEVEISAGKGIIVSPAFEIWPRRAEYLEYGIFEVSTNVPSSLNLHRFRFLNPGPVDVPSWAPETLPATKISDDLEVTLFDFVSGIEGPREMNIQPDVPLTERFQPDIIGGEPMAAVRFQIDSPRGTNETWEVVRYELSDATGNDVSMFDWRTDIPQTRLLSPVLWPDETAWKLTMYFKKVAGFPPEDMLVFDNVAVPFGEASKVYNLTNYVHGFEMLLKSFNQRRVQYWIHHTSLTGFATERAVRLEHPDVDFEKEWDLELISAVSDIDSASFEHSRADVGKTYHEYNFSPFPTNATTMTLIYVVQKIRKVEFFVAPNWVTDTNAAGLAVESE